MLFQNAHLEVKLSCDIFGPSATSYCQNKLKHVFKTMLKIWIKFRTFLPSSVTRWLFIKISIIKSVSSSYRPLEPIKKTINFRFSKNSHCSGTFPKNFSKYHIKFLLSITSNLQYYKSIRKVYSKLVGFKIAESEGGMMAPDELRLAFKKLS